MCARTSRFGKLGAGIGGARGLDFFKRLACGSEGLLGSGFRAWFHARVDGGDGLKRLAFEGLTF